MAPLVALCGTVLGRNRRERHSDQAPAAARSLCRRCYDRARELDVDRHFARAQPGELWHILQP